MKSSNIREDELLVEDDTLRPSTRLLILHRLAHARVRLIGLLVVGFLSLAHWLTWPVMVTLDRLRDWWGSIMWRPQFDDEDEEELALAARRRSIAWFWMGATGLTAAAGIVFLVVSGAFGVLSSWWTIDAQLERGAVAEHRGDDGAALTAYRTALEIDPSHREARFRMALLHARRGAIEDAVREMQFLAPLDEPGYAAAHAWLGQHLVDQEAATTEQVQLARQHLEAAVAEVADHRQARLTLARLAERDGDFEGAARHLAQVSQGGSAVRLWRGRLYTQLGRDVEARKQWELAKSDGLAAITNDPDAVDARTALAHAAIQLGELDFAERVLHEGRQRLPDDAKMADELCELFVLRFSATRSGADLEKRLNWLDEAIRLAPRHPRLLEAVAQLAETREPVRDAARQRCEAIVAEGEALATVHLLLGSIAANEGQFEKAASYFRIGLKLEPNMPELVHGLAHTLVERERPDPLRALQLIDALLKEDASNSEYLETRGFIYAKLQRWMECIADLSQVVKKSKNPQRVHRMLANAYEQAVLDRLSERHAGAAERSGGSAGP